MTGFDEKWRARLVLEASNVGIKLFPDQAMLLEMHALETIKANRKFNITSITDPAEVMEKHVLDSIIAAEQINDNARIIDIGSGGGFPGIPIKIVKPGTDMTLLDKSRKKISFLNYMIRNMGLKKINAVQGRVEALGEAPKFFGTYDVAISRAFASLCQFVKSACPFISEKGYLIAMKGPAVDPEINELLSGPQLEGPWGQTSILPSDIQTISYRLPLTDSRRVLVIVRVRK